MKRIDNFSTPEIRCKNAFDSYREKWRGAAKLACCCGNTAYGQDWFCTDLVENPANNIWSLDITKSFPIGSEELSYIFIEHGVEHIDFQGVIACFVECYRTLKKGGVLRFTSPTLENWIRYYLTDNDTTRRMTFLATQLWIRQAAELDLYSKALAFNNAMRNFGHQLLLDFPTYHDLLKGVGFSEVTRGELSKSSHAALQNMERHAIDDNDIFKEYNEFEVQVIEAVK